jgi:hypothetical protein
MAGWAFVFVIPWDRPGPEDRARVRGAAAARWWQDRAGVKRCRDNAPNCGRSLLETFAYDARGGLKDTVGSDDDAREGPHA